MQKGQEWVVRVTGRVQGVGFRAFACRLAKQHGIAGTVRNCLDGSVEIIAQGSSFNEFISDLHNPMLPIIIDNIDLEEREARTPFQGFSVLP